MLTLRLCGRSCSKIYSKYSKYVRKTSSASATFLDNTVNRDIKPFNEIPGPKGMYNIPYIGTALQFKPFTDYELNDILDLLSETRDKYGDIVKMRLGRNCVVFVYHPELSKTVFQLPYKEYVRTGLDISEIFHKRTNIPKDLGTLQGKEWAGLRKPAQEKMLRPAVVSSYIPLIEQVTNDFVDSLREKGRVDDMLQELMNYTTESVGMLCFNKRLGCLGRQTNSEMAQHARNFFKEFQTAIFMPFKTYKYFRTNLYKRFEHASLEITRIAASHIADNRRRLQNLDEEGKLEEYLMSEPNFLYSLLTDTRLTESKTRGIITSLFLAGIDSTANSMIFVLINLALNPYKQENVYKEIARVVGKSKTLTKDHLNDLPYLKACIKESQRINFPVAIGTNRLLENEIELGGYRIPKGTIVQPNMSAMTMDERFYPNPRQYIPERWLRKTDDQIAKGQNFPFGMMPFGFGPRGCIGQRFAEIEMYIGITKIIQNFQVSLSPEVTKVKSMCQTFTTPAETVVMFLKERERASKMD